MEIRGRDVLLLDLRKLTPEVDYFVIATGTSRRQIRAMAVEGEQVLPPPAAREERDRSLRIIREYSANLAARRRRMADELSCLDGRTLVLYGAGAHAAELLRHTPLGGMVRRIADSDRALWGRKRFGLTVESPEELRRTPPEAVVIASRAYQDEIADSLADLAEGGVELVKLYARSGLY